MKRELGYTALDLEAPVSAENLLDVSAGSRLHLRIPIAVRASGEVLSISVHVLRGAKPGPVIGLLATVTGDSAWGARITMETMSRLDPSDLRGTVVAVPIANPIAFESFTRATGQGMNTDFASMGKTFPGDPKGWLTQRMSAALSSYLLDNVDVVVTYASAADTSIHYTLINGEETEAEIKSRQLSHLLGTELCFIYQESPHPDSVSELAKARGKLAVIPEMGGTGDLPANYLDTCVTSTLNLMKGLGMIEGEPALPERQLVMRPPRVLPRIEHGGIFEPIGGVEVLGRVVEKGTPLGRVINPHTFEVLQEFTAPYKKSGMLMLRTRFSRVNPGDYAYIISDADTKEYWTLPKDWRVEI